MADRIPCPWCGGHWMAWSFDRKLMTCPWCGGDYEVNAPDREPPPASLYDQIPSDCELPSDENVNNVPSCHERRG